MSLQFYMDIIAQYSHMVKLGQVSVWHNNS
jgi:hypothetical protein